MSDAEENGDAGAPRGRGFYLSQAFEKATETWLSWAQKKAFSNQRKQ